MKVQHKKKNKMKIMTADGFLRYIVVIKTVSSELIIHNIV